MDYLTDEEKKRQQQTGQITAPSGQAVGGQPAAGGTAPTLNAENKVAGSGRFQNLQKFISSNQGAGQQLGNKISQDIQGNQQNVQNKINQQQQNIKNAVETEKTRFQNAQGLAGQAGQDASTFVSNAPNKQLLQDAISGKFQQQQVNDLSGLQNDLSGLQRKSQQVGNEQGRFDLLRQNFNLPSYSKGAQRVDQLLLQTAPDALNSLTNLAQQTSQQTGALQDLQASIDPTNTELGNLAATTAEDINNRLSGDISAKRQSYGQRAGEALTGLQGQRSAIENKFRNATPLSEQEMDVLSIPMSQRDNFNTLIALRGPDILNKITVLNANKSTYDITGDALNTYNNAKLMDSVGDTGFISGIQYRRDPRFQLAEYLKQINADEFNEDAATTVDEAEDVNILNQLLGKGDVYLQDRINKLPKNIGYDYNTAINRALSDLAPQYEYGSENESITEKPQPRSDVYQNPFEVIAENPELTKVLNIAGPVGDAAQYLYGELPNSIMTPVQEGFRNVSDKLPAPLGQMARTGDDMMQEISTSAGTTISNDLRNLLEGNIEEKIAGVGDSVAGHAQNSYNTAFNLKNILTSSAQAPMNKLIGEIPDGPLRDLISAPIEIERKISELTQKLTNKGLDIGGNAIKSIARSVGSFFCFIKGTTVEMADGSRKNIEDIKLGDVVALGGRVLAHGQGYSDSIYDYNGIKASEGHTVYHRGEFMRLKNCPDARFYTNEETVVYPICTEEHLIVSNAKIFTDTYEHENQDLTYDEIIYELNSDTNKIILVEDYLYKRTR